MKRKAICANNLCRKHADCMANHSISTGLCHRVMFACEILVVIDTAIQKWEERINAELKLLDEEIQEAFEDFNRAEEELQAPGQDRTRMFLEIQRFICTIL